MVGLASRRWQALAAVVCCGFGFALILNIHPAGDGLWFWYALLLRSHHLLYADMHLALQPLYVLINAMCQSLLGKGWLAGKVPAALQMVIYCFGILLVNRFCHWKDWQKAILLIGVFFLTIFINFYRFDDYHITTDCFHVYSIYLLLRLHARTDSRWDYGSMVVLGILSGLALANRLNDGAALLLAVVIAVGFLVRSSAALSMAVVLGVAVLTDVAVVLMTGDSLHNWVQYSIVGAAAIKGGTGSVLVYPLHLPMAIVKDMWATPRGSWYLIGLSAVVGISLVLSGVGRQKALMVRTAAFVVGGASIVLILKVLGLRSGGTQVILSEAMVLVLFLLSALTVARAVAAMAHRPARHWDPREVLLLLPFGQLLSGAMTSAKSMPNFYPAAVIMLLLVPIASPVRIRSMAEKSVYLMLAAVLGFGTMVYKIWKPYFWHHYTARTLFRNREWYRHPAYGPMYIETEQMQFILPVCRQIADDPGPKELLSLPYPYPNYFCGIAPWHGYVQTWFDTSSKVTINQLIHELETSPPRWIVYQRQLDVMGMHEKFFNGGRPLPQHELDTVIESKLDSGEWAGQRYPFQGAEWFLIRTGR